MNCTVFVSVAPPTTETGELTVAFGAGEQIVTEGLTVERVHDEVDVPVPVNDTVCGLLGSESVSVSVPVRVPVAIGVKVTLTLQLAPAAMLVPQLFACE